MGGWRCHCLSGGGWSKLDHDATLWLHLASWNLPDSQFGWESKMEPSVAIQHRQTLCPPSPSCVSKWYQLETDIVLFICSFERLINCLFNWSLFDAKYLTSPISMVLTNFRLISNYPRNYLKGFREITTSAAGNFCQNPAPKATQPNPIEWQYKTKVWG